MPFNSFGAAMFGRLCEHQRYGVGFGNISKKLVGRGGSMFA